MNPVTDDDLVLYHYRDGLDADRVAHITTALATSQELRDRYAAIERAIAHFGQDEIAPDPDLGARLWRRLEPQLEEAGVVASAAPARGAPSVTGLSGLNRLRAWLASPASARGAARVTKRNGLDRLRARLASPASARGAATVAGRNGLNRLRAWLAPMPLSAAFVAAAVLVIAIGVGFLLGRQSVTLSPRVASTAADAAAGRVLDAYVAANLRATEGVLLTASNSGDASLLEGNREIAQSLVESNRLYALAAARAGNAPLANFLRQLEPVLLSLANQPGATAVQSSEDLRRFLDATDLLFQVRATEARLARDGEPRI